MFTTIELFAGAGGLALGVEKAGFNTIGLVEFNKDACETLKTNRPKWNVICDDIENVSGQDLEKLFQIEKGELDLLSGGAPCQSFSYAGKRLGLEDARGTLFYHYAVFLEKLQPKMFLFENVRGLLTHDKGKTYRTILDIFEKAGYEIQKEILNAWDYGVAQKRERLMTVGIRKDLVGKIHYSFPEKHEYNRCCGMCYRMFRKVLVFRMARMREKYLNQFLQAVIGDILRINVPSAVFLN